MPEEGKGRGGKIQMAVLSAGQEPWLRGEMGKPLEVALTLIGRFGCNAAVEF